MAKIFNTTGLCFPAKHYMIDPLKRLHAVDQLISDELYFTIHAPRQTGKTTYLHTLAQKLNREGKYIALVASFERAGVASMSIEKANETVIDSVYRSATQQIENKYQPENPNGKHYHDLSAYLKRWCESQEKPIVLLIDEIDALLDDVLISILRQLRDGFQSRPKHFPSSIVLVGLRDIRDYKAKIRNNQESMGTASPFNISAKSLLISNFSKTDVFALLDMHTAETGQIFPLAVKEEILYLTNGQPWLVNALANQIVSEILGRDYTREITLDIVSEAKRQLILRRDTHLDSLADKLREDRVKRIVQTIIKGENMSFDILNDDIAYARDLGLISQTSPLKFANPVYAEIIPRTMASPIQESIPEEIQPQWFVESNGALNMEKLLKEFQKFYRRNIESWSHRYEYKESVYQLVLMAFLQRVINSGGDITREMAVGNGRIDMLVKFKKQEFALELKVKHGNYTIEDGKEQLTRYLNRLGLSEGYLIVFDPVAGDWGEKIYYKDISYEDKKIIMVGL